jgi:N-acetylmuramoyl-L-alanine amidase
MPDYVSAPSPNVSDRPEGCVVDTLVLHYTGMVSAEAALARLCSPESEVSSHYLVDERGTVFSLVDEERKAWHAGVSCWRGRAGVNDSSIGVEIANPGHEHGYVPFPEEQTEAVVRLCLDILSRRPAVEPRNVVGHSDVAPNRKSDPGELFPWPALAQRGVGLWPKKLERFPESNRILLFPYRTDDEVKRMQERLRRYGYYIRADGNYGPKTEAVVRAFKRHFVRHAVSVSWDEHAEYALDALLAGVRKRGG